MNLFLILIAAIEWPRQLCNPRKPRPGCDPATPRLDGCGNWISKPLLKRTRIYTRINIYGSMCIVYGVCSKSRKICQTNSRTHYAVHQRPRYSPYTSHPHFVHFNFFRCNPKQLYRYLYVNHTRVPYELLSWLQHVAGSKLIQLGTEGSSGCFFNTPD